MRGMWNCACGEPYTKTRSVISVTVSKVRAYESQSDSLDTREVSPSSQAAASIPAIRILCAPHSLARPRLTRTKGTHSLPASALTMVFLRSIVRVPPTLIRAVPTDNRAAPTIVRTAPLGHLTSADENSSGADARAAAAKKNSSDADAQPSGATERLDLPRHSLRRCRRTSERRRRSFSRQRRRNNSLGRSSQQGGEPVKGYHAEFRIRKPSPSSRFCRFQTGASRPELRHLPLRVLRSIVRRVHLSSQLRRSWFEESDVRLPGHRRFRFLLASLCFAPTVAVAQGKDVF